jgi:hypothetical protein
MQALSQLREAIGWASQQIHKPIYGRDQHATADQLSQRGTHRTPLPGHIAERTINRHLLPSPYDHGGIEQCTPTGMQGMDLAP